jgi:hypothetical protein
MAPRLWLSDKLYQTVKLVVLVGESSRESADLSFICLLYVVVSIDDAVKSLTDVVR